MMNIADDSCVNRSLQPSLEMQIKKFSSWCSQNDIKLSEKVQFALPDHGSCARYGMVAIEDISVESFLFSIPRNATLSASTSVICDLLSKESNCLLSDSGWVPLLLSMMYEFTSGMTKWQPYFDVLPPYEELDLPFSWPVTELSALLSGTGVCEMVARDLNAITREFSDIVLPFVKRFPDIFHKRCHDIEFYKYMVALVMAYSFTEALAEEDDESSDESSDCSDRQLKSKLVMMVPVADILNHKAKNNARLDFGKTHLLMRATRDIKKGEEILNTYGDLPNSHLLHMYGFAEPYPENHYDTVDISLSIIHSLDIVNKSSQISLLNDKLAYLDDRGFVPANSTIIVGVDGILTETEIYCLLKILCMDDEQFKRISVRRRKFIIRNTSFANEAISELPETWKLLLTQILKQQLQCYEKSFEEEQLLITNAHSLPKRSLYSLFTRYGQIQILTKLICLCEGS